MNFSPSDVAVWLFGIALEIALLLSLRRHWRDFPAFGAYCIFCFFRSLLLVGFYVSANHMAYFVAYWTCIGVGMLIMLMVAREALAHVLRPWFGIPSDLWGGAVVLAVCAGIVGALTASITMGPPLAHALTTTLDTAQKLIVCVLLAVFLYVLLFPPQIWIRPQWPEKGVALGFCVSQGALALSMMFGASLLARVGFLVAQVIWIVAMSQRR